MTTAPINGTTIGIRQHKNNMPPNYKHPSCSMVHPLEVQPVEHEGHEHQAREDDHGEGHEHDVHNVLFEHVEVDAHSQVQQERGEEDKDKDVCGPHAQP